MIATRGDSAGKVSCAGANVELGESISTMTAIAYASLRYDV